jgi:hypothetical protein
MNIYQISLSGLQDPMMSRCWTTSSSDYEKICSMYLLTVFMSLMGEY